MLVTSPSGFNGYLISNIFDLLKYAETLDNTLTQRVNDLVKHEFNVDNWTEINYHDDIGNKLTIKLYDSIDGKECPIFNFGKAFDLKIKNIKSALESGKRIIINENGGYCYYE